MSRSSRRGLAAPGPVPPPRRRRAPRLGAFPRAAPRARLRAGGRRAVPRRALPRRDAGSEQRAN